MSFLLPFCDDNVEKEDNSQLDLDDDTSILVSEFEDSTHAVIDHTADGGTAAQWERRDPGGAVVCRRGGVGDAGGDGQGGPRQQWFGVASGDFGAPLFAAAACSAPPAGGGLPPPVKKCRAPRINILGVQTVADRRTTSGPAPGAVGELVAGPRALVFLYVCAVCVLLSPVCVGVVIVWCCLLY